MSEAKKAFISGLIGSLGCAAAIIWIAPAIIFSDPIKTLISYLGGFAMGSTLEFVLGRK